MYVGVSAGAEHSIAITRDRDCDQNGVDDATDIANGAVDCDSNGAIDSCDIVYGLVQDCNFNGAPDSCDIIAGSSDCNANGIPDFCDVGVGASLDVDSDGVPDECIADCNSNGIPDSVEMALGAGDCDGDWVLDVCEVDINLDFVPDECQSGGSPYCFGVAAVGGAAVCPCGNIGTAGNGCPNSQNSNGGRLEAVGLPSRVADTLVLLGSQMPSAAAVMYFQGTSSTNGLAFGDGLRCATGLTLRLGYAANVNGASRWPPVGGVAIHMGGQIPSTGAVTRYYQGWYRDASATFCTTNRYNLTNGVAVVWVP
jgi:hypothetical protein